MGRILIRQPDGTRREPDPAGYAAEVELQQILAEHPELIPGVSAEALPGIPIDSRAGRRSRRGCRRTGDARPRCVGRRLCTVSVFHFSGQGTSVEFSLIPMSRLPDDEWPVDTAIEAFLSELESTPGLADVGRNLRASRFTTRRPNVSLASLDEESVRRGLRAVMLLRGPNSKHRFPEAAHPTGSPGDLRSPS